MKKVLIKILKFYKKRISPNIKSSCIFTPTCSEYAISALKKHNVFKALKLIIFRVLRCNPLSSGGFDPVPDSKKVVKWLF